MKKKVLNDFPQLKGQILELESLFNQLRKRRKVIAPPHPTYDKAKDLYHYLTHYINIIHLKLIHQLSLLLLGIKGENPEISSTVRSCIETIGALAYMIQEISKEKIAPEKAWDLLNIATMGENKKTMSKQIIFSNAPQVFHSADYVRAIGDTLDKELQEINSKNRGYILERYDFFSEYTHPNYLALEPYWEVTSEKLKYNKKISCIRESQLTDILFTIIPLILVYEFVLRKAEKLEEKFKTMK